MDAIAARWFPASAQSRVCAASDTDVLAFRLQQRPPARAAAALGTLSVVAFYLIAQMVGAGVLIQALAGIDFTLAVVITGGFMLCYVVFGGMLATTWVQIVKAVLLMSATFVLTLLVFNRIGWNPLDLFTGARDYSPAGDDYLAPGLRFENPIDTLSLGLGLVLATAGLRTSSCASSRSPTRRPRARASYLMTTALGFGARAILGEGGVEAAGKGGNLVAPILAEELGGGRGDDRRRPLPRGRRRPRDLGLGRHGPRRLVEHRAQGARLRARGGPRRAHRRVLRQGGGDRHRDPRRRGEGLNVSFMVGLAFAVAASANFPALLPALTWPRFKHRGRRHRRALRRRELDRAHHPQPHGLARPGLRGLAVRPREPGHHLGLARLPRLLAGDRAEPRASVGGRLRGARCPRRPGSAPSAPSG